MSRLKDALLQLVNKCTPEGTKPHGDNVDEILECLAAHFGGGVSIAKVVKTSVVGTAANLSVSDLPGIVEGSTVTMFVDYGTANSLPGRAEYLGDNDISCYSTSVSLTDGNPSIDVGSYILKPVYKNGKFYLQAIHSVMDANALRTATKTISGESFVLGITGDNVTSANIITAYYFKA